MVTGARPRSSEHQHDRCSVAHVTCITAAVYLVDSDAETVFTDCMKATRTKTFRSFDGALIHVLDNGLAVRESITGLWLLTEVGGEIIRPLNTLDEVAR